MTSRTHGRLALPAWTLPAWITLLVLAAVTAGMMLGGSQATAPRLATAQVVDDGRYHALVFSRTTGFRHTAAINAGRTALEQMGTDEDFAVTLSEDQTLFSDHNLRNYDVIVFLNTDGEGILNQDQRSAFERWTQRGGGAVRIHADGNADKAWDWKRDMMGGGLFNNHPPIQEATVEVTDSTHPATADLPATFQWSDEWYNFDADPRDEVHVLMTVDDSTYNGSEHGPGHPIAWCSEYDGGLNFYTAIGHADGGSTPAWSDDRYLDHIFGALEWAAGEAEGDCGEPRAGIPTEGGLTKVELEDDIQNPMELAVANDGRVFFIELGFGAAQSFPAAVKLYDPEPDETFTVGEIDVHRGNENGLLGITLDPDFDDNNFIYLFYSEPMPAGPDEHQNISRFTFDPDAGAVGEIDMDSEVTLLEIPHQRVICCHSSGSMTFGPDGFLYASTGDDSQHADSQGYTPIDGRVQGNVSGANPDAQHARDARRSSGNTADLRGKILRIKPIDSATPSDEPGVDSTYEVDDDNLFTSGDYDHLFPGGEYDPELGRPEIYTMGHRNPFRISVDQETGWVYNGEVGPDANNDSLAPPPSNGRGPRGYDEVNQIREAGNMGWPYCIADNQAYRPWAFEGTSGGGPDPDQDAPYFDCNGGPTNTSPWNTGLDVVPPTSDAFIWYPYGASPEFPEIPLGGGRATIGGPVYHYDPGLDSDVKLSEWFDGKLFWGDWSRNWMAMTTMDEDGDYVDTEQFMPGTEFRSPHDIELGPDGALYMLEWGFAFNYAGQTFNLDSGLYRIEQRLGGLPALANAQSSRSGGPIPLEVQFTGELSDRGADQQPTYEWDFGDGSPTSNEINPTHTYTEIGQYTVTLTVTDDDGETTDTITINARQPSTGCLPVRSDDFEGDALDDDRWEVVRRDDDRLSVADGALNLVSAPQDIFGGETGLPNIVLQEIPGGGDEPWSITTEMTWNPTQDFQNAGLMIYTDDANYIKTGMVWNGARNFELIKELGDAATFEGTVGAGDIPETYFLRIVSSNGNAIEAQFSGDGNNWTTIGTSNLDGLTNPRIGVYATASTQAGAAEITASYHSVMIDPDEVGDCPNQCPSDEFDGTELDPKWSFSHPSMEVDPVVEDGNLVLTLSSFSFDADRPGPASVVGQPMLLDDWEAVAKISAPDLADDDSGQSQYAKVGLVIWQDSDNEPNKHFISYTHNRDAGNDGEMTFFEASAQNGPAEGDRTLGDPVGQAAASENLAGPFWIRVTRTGDAIEGFYSLTDPANNPNWVSINSGATSSLNIEQVMPGDEGPIYVGPYGANGSTEASFDYVRFSPEDPECDGGGEPDEDTTPPVTTHELDPAEPGPGGTYGGPVNVTLSAIDPPGNGSGGEPQNHDVDAEPGTWDPDELEIAFGDEVTWNFPSSAGFSHDVWLLEPGDEPDAAGFEVTDGPVPADGDPVSYTFTQAGAWTFVCKLHSSAASGQWTGMVGTVEVGEPDGGAEPSGVDYTEYRVNTDGETGEWTRADNESGDDPFVTQFTVADDGSHEVEYRSADNAENEEELQTVSFEITDGDVGVPDVRLAGVPKQRKVGPKAKVASFRARAINRGDGPTGTVNLIAKAPAKRLKTLGPKRRTFANIDPGARRQPLFRFRIKKSARGKVTKIRLLARGPNIDNQQTTVRLRARK